MRRKDGAMGRSVVRAAGPIPERAVRAHAMKNCATVVRAVARLVRPELSPRSAERMDRLDAALDRMMDLLDQDFAPEPDETGATERTLVRDLVVGACRLLYDRAEAATVALVVNCDDGAVRVDAPSMREAIMNLVSNALEATPPGGAVFVDSCTMDGGDQLITVQDTGSGMSPEVLRHLGKPRATYRAEGSGFGIALAADTVRAHGGVLRFDSLRACGTRVTIWLPGADAASGEDDASRAS